MKDEKTYYKTRDFYLACFLKVKNLKIEKILKDKNIATFCFEERDCLKDFITGFYNGSESVNANDFINSIRDLKALIHNI